MLSLLLLLRPIELLKQRQNRRLVRVDPVALDDVGRFRGSFGEV